VQALGIEELPAPRFGQNESELPECAWKILGTAVRVFSSAK
jgi:hypothetical protein